MNSVAPLASATHATAQKPKVVLVEDVQNRADTRQIPINRVGIKEIVHPVKVRHTVESTGFVISRGRAAFAISGDTGPTRAFWRAASEAPGLGALLVETSFPTALQWLADLSGHLTPRTLVAELSKVKRDPVPVYLYHLKPAWAAALRKEIAGLRLRGVKVLDTGDAIVV